MSTDPLAQARAEMKRQAQEAGQPVTERWHNHLSLDTCGSQCPAPGTGWDGRGLVTDHFTDPGEHGHGR